MQRSSAVGIRRSAETSDLSDTNTILPPTSTSSLSFPCTWTGCNKAYAKADHLHRHERTHTGLLKYGCPYCDKRYARSDVLSRHMASKHGATPAALGRPRKIVCSPCVELRLKCDGKPPEPCSACKESLISCHYASFGDVEDSSEERFDRRLAFENSSAARRASERHSRQDLDVNYDQADDTGWAEPQPVSLPITLPPSHPSPAVASPLTSQLFLLADAAAETQLDNLSIFGSTSGIPGVYDWDLGEPVLNLFESFNTNAPNTPSLNFLHGMNWDLGQSSEVHVRPAVNSTAATATAQSTWMHQAVAVAPDTDPDISSSVPPREIPDGQPYDSPWPHIYKPRNPDAHVEPFLEHSASFPSIVTSTNRVPESSRAKMVTLIHHSHEGIWSSVDVSNFPSTDTLTVCVNLYFRHFHDWLPVFNKGAFQLDDAHPILLMSASAIGATYSRDGLQNLGLGLNELVRRAILYFREHDHRLLFETYVIQAALLQSYFGIFCGNQQFFQQAESFRGNLITACKRMHLLRPGISALEELLKGNSAPQPQEMEKARAEDERRRRLGWGIYLYDAQLACLLNLPAQLSIMEVVVPLPTSDANSAAADSPSPMFPWVLERLLTGGNLIVQLDDLGLSIISHTLYRMCLDAAVLQHIIPTFPTGQRYSLVFPPHIKHNPQLLLDRLAASTFHSSASPTPLMVGCAALAYHAHMQFTITGFLDKVKIAAGKSGTSGSKESAKATLVQLINVNHMATRNILAHAAMLTCLLDRFTFDAPTEVIFRFDAALCFWAITKHSEDLARHGKPEVTISWSESSAVDRWIKLGGNATFQAVGECALLTPSSTLRIFAEHLDRASWGLAQRYRRVLLSLLQEETF